MILAVLFFLSPSIVCHAGSAALSVNATVLSKSICKLNSNSSTVSFGTLDPGNPVDITANASIGFVCRGSAPIATFIVTDDDGLHETGPDANRMRHASVLTEYLPYRLTLAPTSGTAPKNAPQSLVVTGTVQGIDYSNAYAGSYSDTVVVSLLP